MSWKTRASSSRSSPAPPSMSATSSTALPTNALRLPEQTRQTLRAARRLLPLSAAPTKPLSGTGSRGRGEGSRAWLLRLAGLNPVLAEVKTATNRGAITALKARSASKQTEATYFQSSKPGRS